MKFGPGLTAPFSGSLMNVTHKCSSKPHYEFRFMSRPTIHIMMDIVTLRWKRFPVGLLSVYKRNEGL